MASPITSDSFDNSHLSDDLCTSFQEKFLNNSKLKDLLAYLFDSSGNIASTFATDLIELLPPIGEVLWFANDPNLDSVIYLKAEGQQVLKADYARLLAIYGTLYDRALDTNTATMFRIPDLRSRFLLGNGTGFSSADDIANETEPNIGASVGDTGGAKSTEFTLAVENIAPHSHPIGFSATNSQANPTDGEEGRLQTTYRDDLVANTLGATRSKVVGGHAGTESDPVTPVTVNSLPPYRSGVFLIRANWRIAGNVL